MSVLATEDAAAITATLPLLPNDGQHDRGTFPGADLVLAGRAGSDAPSLRRFELGNDVTEADLTGIDATTGSAATLQQLRCSLRGRDRRDRRAAVGGEPAGRCVGGCERWFRGGTAADRGRRAGGDDAN